MAAVDSRPFDSTRDNGESLTSFRPYEEPSLGLRSRGGGRQVQQGSAKGSGSPKTTKHVTTGPTASTATRPSHPQQSRNLPRGPPASSTKPTAAAAGTKQEMQRASGSSIQRQGSVPGRGGAARKLVSQSSTTSLSGATALGVTSTGGGSGSMGQSHRSIVEEQIDKIISSNTLQVSESAIAHWMPDKLCHECSECGVRFSLFVRRHHCRVCGRIYCHSCSNHTIPGNLFRPNMTGNIRVCLACKSIFYEVVSIRTNQEVSNLPPLVTRSLMSTSTGVSDTGTYLDTDSISVSSSLMQSRVSWDPESEVDVNSPSRSSSIGIEFDNPTPSRLHRTLRKTVGSEENILALAEDEVEVRLQEIWQKFCDKSTGPYPVTHRHRFRNFPSSYSAHEIIEWLLHMKMARSREMAERIGEALVHTKCLKIVSSQDQVFKDSKDIILEMGEDNQLSNTSTSPTVADAPNWFLSNEDEAHSQFEKKTSLTEANLDIDSGLATFRRKRLADVFALDNPIPEEPSSKDPAIVVEEVPGGPSKDDFEVINNEGLPQEAIEVQEPDRSIAPGHYVFPPTATLHPLSFDSTIHSVTSFSILDPDAANPGTSIPGFSKATQAAKQFEELSVYNEIKSQHLSSYHQHLDAFLIQQLRTFGLSLEWLETIRPLVLTASHTVSTDVTPDDFMDITAYCKVKKVPGGRMSSSSFINGVVFTKHVIHKKMNMSLRNPRILLLKCAFEFQRKENQLSSFDTLLSQEKEYLKNLVERVKSVRPSVILVQKSVSRFALEILHSHGIVVVVNIKPSVMGRIARSTQADLITNLDQLYFDIKLGTCGHFYVRTYTLPDGIRKTLIYLDECEPRLGGVIMLQGNSKNVLKRVKKVVLFGLQTAYNMKLECSYLSDLLVVPSPDVRIKDSRDDDEYLTPPLTPTQSLHRFSPSAFMEEGETVSATASTQQVIEEKEEDPEDPVPEDTNTHTTEPLPTDTSTGTADTGTGTDTGTSSTGTGSTGTGTGTSSTDTAGTGTDTGTISTGTGSDTSTGTGTGIAGTGTGTGTVQLTSEEAFQAVLSSHIISMSPYLSFATPYLQTEQGLKAHIRCYLPQSIYWSHWFKPSNKIPHSPDQYNAAPSDGSQSQLPLAPTASVQAAIRYRSVSSHPFTHSSFLLPISNPKANSTNNGYKAALADFRSRAMSRLLENTCEFFFPAAKRSGDVYQRLEGVFAGSRDFELMAGHWWNDNKEETFPDINEQEIDDATVPQHTHSNEGSYSSSPSLRDQGIPNTATAIAPPPPATATATGDDEEEEGTESVDNAIGLTQVLEQKVQSPDYKGQATRTGPPVPSNGEWSGFLMDDNLPNANQSDCLDPSNHQFLSLVFSSTCNDEHLQKQLYPCVQPCHIPMNYYGRNDIPLGEFLHRYCFRDSYICQSCEIDMSKHQRHFVHGRQEVRISMQQLAMPIPGGDKNIFTWSSCLKCKNSQSSTPLLPLSADTLLYSFAKFLDLKFYGNNYVSFNFNGGQDSNGKEESLTISTCTHPINTSYIQYFCFGDKVAVFESLPIDIFEVRIPPQHVTIETASSIQWHHSYPEEIKRLGKIVEGVFFRVMQYLALFNIEPAVSKVKDAFARAKAMRENYRNKVKRLKDLCAHAGVFPRLLPPVEADEEVSGNVFILQDSVADLKRLIAEAVFCFNIELDEIDTSLREVFARKDGLSTPLSTEDQTPSVSPHSSPQSKRRPNDRLFFNKTSPTLTKKSGATLTPPSWQSQSIDCSTVQRRHKRQFSDSLALPVSHGEAGVSVSTAESSKEDISDELMVRRDHSLSATDSLELPPTITSTGDIRINRSAHSSTDNISNTGGVTAGGVLDPPEGTSDRMNLALEEPEESVYMSTLLKIDDTDILQKLRGKDSDDVKKFYIIQATGGHDTDNGDAARGGKLSGPSPKRYPASGPAANGKSEDVDSASAITKPSEKKQTLEKLPFLFSKPFQRLPSPFDPTEHHLIRGSLRFHVSVYENEPTSIIAFALCSREYANELKLLLDERKKGITESTTTVPPAIVTEGESSTSVPPTASRQSGFKQLKTAFSDWYKSRHPNTSSTPTANDTSSTGSVDQHQQHGAVENPVEDVEGEKENELFASIKWNSTPDTASSSRFSSSHENRHISLEFTDETAKFFCKVYYAEEFRKLREHIYPDGEEKFIRSLARCVRYEAKGGKSRAMFLKTFEDRLIMKQVQMVEITSFIDTALQYFQHVTEAIKSDRPLVLAKILGAYSIGFRNSKTGNSKRHHVIIMENLLYGHRCTKVFDLKGSMRGRYVSRNTKNPEVTGEVLMDENFLEYIYNTPVYVWPHSKTVLMQAIQADTQFLATNSIMDYSLLTALDQENGELVVGIIDFVRPFTLDKFLEMFIKKAGRSVLPTVVYPELYRKRFIDAMDRYFTPVPDKWTGLGADVKLNISL